MPEAIAKPRLELLSREQLERLHEATVTLLERTGVIVKEPRAIRLLREAGCETDPRRELVRIPRHLIEEAVRKTVRSFPWYGRHPARAIRVGEGRTKLGPGSTCTHLIDLETGKPRPASSDDAIACVRLLDALEHVSINFTPVAVAEHPPQVESIIELALDAKYTTKCLMGGSFNGRIARDSLRIGAILAGGEEELRKRPTLAGYVDPVSPLVHDRPMTETLLEYAAMGQPLFLTCLDLAGASAPVTLAGTLVQQNAEVLSGLLIAQLVHPHPRVIYGTVSSAMDLRAGTAASGGPEATLLSIASIQLAHWYGLPATGCAQSDAKVPDAQAAYEKALGLAAAVWAGADLVDLYFGSFETFNTWALEQAVIDNEIAGMVFRVAEGLALDEEAFALEHLDRIGAGGNFLADQAALQFTMARLRGEHWLPTLSDRRSRVAWESAGARELREAARERARKILKEHVVEPLDSSMANAIDEVVREIVAREAKGSSS